MRKVIIQGFPGSFHDDIAHRYFGEDALDLVCAASFGELVHRFCSDHTIDSAVMAIENSIAGTILQNYRLVREAGLHIVGEAYLRIKMNLIGHKGVQLEDLTEVHSHPMALYQCTLFLNDYPKVKLVESEDTALSVKYLSESGSKNVAAIASLRAAQLYGLSVLQAGIENNKSNYTRFFILARDKQTHVADSDKASIWCTISHEKGSLARLLQLIHSHDVNLSKLQSYPLLGTLSAYSFHLDLEFDTVAQYRKLRAAMLELTGQFQELGLYKRADITAAANTDDTIAML